MIRKMEKESFIGQMVKYFKDFGKMENKMAKEF